MDIPIELRDDIYTKALITDSVLVEKQFQDDFLQQNPPPIFGPEENPLRHPATHLLLVSRTVSAEASTIFYGINKFEESAPYCRPISSVFVTHAAKFRKVVLDLYSNPAWKSDELHEAHHMVEGFRAQIRSLTAMTKLEYLQLNVSSLLSLSGPPTRCGNIKESIPFFFNILRPTLLSCVPMSVRNKPGSPGAGIWIETSRKAVDHGTTRRVSERLKIGALWSELGVNFIIPDTRFKNEHSQLVRHKDDCILTWAPTYYDRATMNHLRELRLDGAEGCTCSGFIHP